MRALCYIPDAQPSLLNEIAMIVHASGGMYVHCQDEGRVIEEMKNQDQTNTLLLTEQGTSDFLQVFSERFPKSLIIVGLHTPLNNLDPRLRNCLAIHSFVAFEKGQFDFSDLMTTLTKFKTKDIFGIEKYLKSDTEIVSEEIGSDVDKYRVLERIQNSVHYLGDFSKTSRFYQYSLRTFEMADELILNAIFHANPKFKKKNRSSPFVLDPLDSVRVSWGFDGEIYALSIADNFGLLRKETILEYLDITLDHGSIANRDSAGLGFRSIFERLHKFVVNVNEGLATEAVCLLRFDRRIKDFDNRMRSFHYFKV